MHEIWLPRKFLIDHMERDLPYGEIINDGKRGFLVRCNDDELAELLSDADYYSDCASPGWDITNALAIQSSARATVQRINRYLARN